MIAPAQPPPSEVARFRTKLLVAMMVVVSAATIGALYFGQRNAARAVEQELRREFQASLTALHNVQELRHAALVERCRALVRRPRIHAALEDNALDLLYPSARDELRDLMMSDRGNGDYGGYALHAEFYRFLDRSGAVIPPGSLPDVGPLRPEDERRLALPAAPERQQLGYLPARAPDGTDLVLEVLAMPIISTETGEVIAALVVGFKPADFVPGGAADTGIRRGLWMQGRLKMDDLPPASRIPLEREVAKAIAVHPAAAAGVPQDVAGRPHLLFYKRLNPDSLFPAAYEVCVYPLTELRRRQRELGLQVGGVAVLLLLGGLGVSHLVAGRLARPVEKLAVDSAENRAQRARAEAALELTNEELQRAARFSADASHQLKTPVTVLRAGLEELLSHEHLTGEECHEISTLIHQTYRLSGVIEDLLLLSRMDAGRMTIDFKPVDFSYVIETALDDLGAQSDDHGLAIETDFPPGLQIEGEKRYLGVILQNLLENARKYNRPGGTIRITARAEAEAVSLRVRNTGRPIPPEAQALIFERFHRGAMGENVPGYGLGLNLARELARLHHGELRLVASDEEGTEFEVRFPHRSPATSPKEKGS